MRLIEIDEFWEHDLTPPEADVIPEVEPTWYEKFKRAFNLASKWRIRRKKRALVSKTSATNVRRGEGLEHLRAIKAHK